MHRHLPPLLDLLVACPSTIRPFQQSFVADWLTSVTIVCAFANNLDVGGSVKAIDSQFGTIAAFEAIEFFFSDGNFNDRLVV